MKVGLVACAAGKQNHPAPARELYTSPLFRKASAYCEREYDCWYILSALHGVVKPFVTVSPYDRSLNAMSREARLAWGEMVRRQLDLLGHNQDDLYLHAGARYREPFATLSHVHVPLIGRGIGRQLRWYIDRGI